MHLKNFLFVLIVIICLLPGRAQKPFITMLDSGRKTSFRGLSVVSDNIVWASGAHGTVAKSTNGGKTFQWLIIQGYEERDFRDIEAFDSNTAVIMGVDEPAIILKTRDGGKTWKKVFEDTTQGMFLDAIDFSEDNKYGVVIGDPIRNYLFLASTNDSGETWQIVNTRKNEYKTNDSEAFFAASGTNIKLIRSNTLQKDDLVYVSGGKKSRLFIDNKWTDLPIIQGEQSTGANSIAILNDKAIVVGGDFLHDTSTKQNCIVITFDPKKQKPRLDIPLSPPHGYRSCVEYITGKKLVTCGTSGVDISNDGGMNWELISTEGFHVCRKAKVGSKIFLAGTNGKIGVLSPF